MTDDRLGALRGIIDQAAEIQRRLDKLASDADTTTAIGRSGDGLVSVTMTLGGEVTDLRIDHQALDPSRVDELQDMIRAAFNDAQQQLRRIGQESLSSVQNFINGMPY